MPQFDYAGKMRMYPIQEKMNFGCDFTENYGICGWGTFWR